MPRKVTRHPDLCCDALGNRLVVNSKTARTLENESGHRAEPDTRIASMLTCVSAGRWEEALSLLSDVQVRAFAPRGDINVASEF